MKIIVILKFLLFFNCISQAQDIEREGYIFSFSQEYYKLDENRMTIVDSIKNTHYLFKDSSKILTLIVDSLDRIQFFGEYEFYRYDTAYITVTHPDGKVDTSFVFINKAILQENRLK